MAWLLIVAILLLRNAYVYCLDASNIPANRSQIFVVIARYQEPTEHLQWLSGYPHVIYNRGEAFPNTSLVHSIDVLDNVGRESFIYLSYIVHNYFRLSNITIFSQAVQSWDGYGDGHFKRDVEALVDGTIVFSPGNDGFMYLIPACVNVRAPQYIRWFQKRYGHDSAGLLWTGYKDLLGFDIGNPRFTPTALFAVTREAVLRKPRDYYAALARRMASEADSMLGHFFERAWPQVFRSSCSSGQDFKCHYDPAVNCG
mmetsp:Transcript_34111/g.49553  ORF Transcript_34111/g.49553 Transcript_34111/m.49553 type:complete len:256 (+) Transcript_34111:2-769(+)|eukprot:CAMPEP_0170116200 /NCGR_PEP_ID=MMETSP0020_2-20130122/12093_1 /TAXON_ID=98059 /ORGANISM="Dinobryon sp., Strain UTEXLB2267" /LENGTH=255 /DNA_ID=CAMNT_0010344203 /DNA_START=1 /DNA_END=768 /DNA_ORIENTATION=+